MFNDPVPFLANIIKVARSDGRLSAEELAQLELIRKEFGFRKGDFATAMRLAEDEDYKLCPVGGFSDQVKNLELILRVAFADCDLEASEQQLINEFCKKIGVYHDQVEKIASEILESLKSNGKICAACATENTIDALFCMKCGASLKEQERDIQLNFTIPATGMAIEFAESSSALFPRALEHAKKTAGYQSCKKNKKSWYLATFDSGSLVDALPLIEALSNVRNKVLYIDGREKTWNEFLGFIWCSSNRESAYLPAEYCFGKDDNRLNPWGCKQARMDWVEWSTWFCYGKWEKTGSHGANHQWRFDKERIKHELWSNLHKYRYCPHLNKSLPDFAVEHLPDVVIPGIDAGWDYHRAYEETPGSIKVVQTEQSNGFMYTNEFWADGVRPKGLSVLSEILSKALRDAGMDAGFLSSLIR